MQSALKNLWDRVRPLLPNHTARAEAGETESVSGVRGPESYAQLGEQLAAAGFDAYVAELTAKYLPNHSGRDALSPSVGFRMLLVGALEDIDSCRGIAWRCADSQALATFVNSASGAVTTPDHRALRTWLVACPRRLLEAVLEFGLQLAARGGLKLRRHVSSNGDGVSQAIETVEAEPETLAQAARGYLSRLASRESIVYRELPARSTAESAWASRTSSKLLSWVVEQSLLVFGSWTLGFHVALLGRWPAWSTYPAFAVIYSVLWLAIRPKWRVALQGARRSPWFAATVLALSGLLGLFVLYSFRPHPEDVMLFHRALVQLEHMDEPFLMENTQLNERGLPIYAIMFAMTSVEMLTAFLAYALRGDALWYCQHVGQIAAAALLPIVYVLLFRRLRVGPVIAIAATAGVVLFLLIDGSGRSFGHFAFTHLKMGKAILFTIMIPLTLLYTLRYLAAPRARTLCLLFLCGVSAVGLSGSGLFLIPMLIFAASAAYVAAYGLRLKRLKRAVLVNLGSLYCVAVAGTIASGILPPPRDTLVWDSFPNDWWKNLNMVLINNETLFRNVVLLAGVPLATLRWKQARFLLLYELALVCAFANPVTGPIVIKIVRPGAFWRLIYLLPVPLCAGLLVKCLPVRRWQRQATRRLLHRAKTLLSIAIVFIGMSLRWLKFVIRELATTSPLDYMFPRFDAATFRARAKHCRAHDVVLQRGDRYIGFRLAVLATALVATRLALSSTVWGNTYFKAATAYSLPGRESAIARGASEHIARGANVLCPEEIQLVLGLLRPDLTFEVEERYRTIHTYRNVDRNDDALMRVRAGDAVTRGPQRLGVHILYERDINQAFDSALEHGVDHIIVYAVARDWVQGRLSALGISWGEVWRDRQAGVSVLHLVRPAAVDASQKQ